MPNVCAENFVRPWAGTVHRRSPTAITDEVWLAGRGSVLGELLGGQPGLLRGCGLPNSVGQWQWSGIDASSDQPRMRIDRSHIWYVDFVV